MHPRLQHWVQMPAKSRNGSAFCEAKANPYRKALLELLDSRKETPHAYRPGRKGWSWSIKGRLWKGELWNPTVQGSVFGSSTFSAAVFLRG